MWPSVNGNVLTNQIDIQSEKTHEVTRCKQALSLNLFMVAHFCIKLGRPREYTQRYGLKEHSLILD